MKNYTQNWTNNFINNTKFLEKKISLCLEIGCFEGLTSNYIVENLLVDNGKLICLDPLTDNYYNDDLTEEIINLNKNDFSCFSNQYERFINNTKEFIDNKKIELVRKLSKDAFSELIKDYENKFDFIYIDGDHRLDAVYLDGINSLKLCSVNGYILFDDYEWHECGLGIDKFLDEFNGKYELIYKKEQVLIKKI
jgi:hypothetical protein